MSDPYDGKLPVIYVDTETTSLDPRTGEVWDIALIEANGTEHEWHIRPKRAKDADPGSLRINHFYERTGVPGNGWVWHDGASVAMHVALLTANKILVGAVPWFDAGFLDAFLMEHGQRGAWHYHMVDVETLAAGKLGLLPPWSLVEIATILDIDAARFEKHTAIGDARLAKAVYEAVLG